METVMSADRYVVFETALGFVGLGWSDAGLTRLVLPGRDREATARRLLRRDPDAEVPSDGPGGSAAVGPRSGRRDRGLRGGRANRLLRSAGRSRRRRRFPPRHLCRGKEARIRRDDHLWRAGSPRRSSRTRPRDRGSTRLRTRCRWSSPATAFLPPAARSAAFRRPAARPPRKRCWHSKACASAAPRRRSARSGSRTGQALAIRRNRRRYRAGSR